MTLPRQVLSTAKPEDAQEGTQEPILATTAPRRDSKAVETCQDCGGALVGQASLDGLHFDGECPKCGARWAIRLATGR